jgi:SAM-dependent methyltransferase
MLFAIMKLRGDGNIATQNPERAADEWQARLDSYGVSLEGRHVLELGSGQYARLALHMLKRGARRVTLVDLYAVPLSDPAHRKMLLEDCAQLGLDAADAFARIDVHSVDFLTMPVPAPSERPDIITSLAVLEHVQDPAAILAACGKWLAPGGKTIHIIDLRDHNLQFRYPFEMLTYSDWMWRRWLDLRGGFHVNRWRAHQHLNALAAAGFAQVTYEAMRVDKDGLRAVRNRLDQRFRDLPEQLLAIQMLSIYGTKPV